MKNHFILNFSSTVKSALFILIILFFCFSITAAQSKLSKGLQLIEQDKISGLITAEEALVQEFYYGFNKAKLNEKYFFENDAPGKCATEIFKNYKQEKADLSQKTIASIESCINPLRKRAAAEFTYISPSGKFELTYSTEGSDAVSAEDLDNSGVPDYVERIANYFDYSWKFVVDTLGYLAPPIGDGRYQIIFENSGYFGYTDAVEDRLTYISMSNSFDGFSENDDPEGDAIGAAKVTAIHEFMHACQIVYNNWQEPSWFAEAHATWVEDIGYDYINDYYIFLSGSNIKNPNRTLTLGDGYSDCIFLHCLTQKFGVQITRDIWERIGIYNWEFGLNSIDAILQNYNSSFNKVLPEYYTWCFLTGENSDNRLPSFKDASGYPTSRLNDNITIFPHKRESTFQKKISADFLKYSVDETHGHLSFHLISDNYENRIALITYFKDSTVAIDYYPIQTNKAIDTDYKLQNIDHCIIIPVNTSVLYGNSYELSVDFYRDIIFKHTPVASSEDISPKIITTKIKTTDYYKDYNSLILNYKLGNGEFQSLSLAKTDFGNNYSAEITDINDGDTISYYFSYYDSLRSFNNTLPLTAPDSLFSFMCGIDNISPRLYHNPSPSITKFDFPRRLFANISDNYNVASAYVEYTVNNGDSKKIDFIRLKDSLYYAPLFMDTTFCNTNDQIDYRIVVNDSAISNNTTIYPQDNKHVNLKINKGYKYDFDGYISYDYWNNIYTDTITINDDITIRDLNISLDISNLSDNDSLLINLISPNGDEIILHNKISLSCDSLSIIFDDEADLDLNLKDILLKNNFINDHYKPATQNLSMLNGMSSKGDWIITISGAYIPSSLSFNEWGLIIQTDEIISDLEEQSENLIATEYSLNQNYPNPFNPSTTISYSLAKKGFVELNVYDMLGREIINLVNKEQNAGQYNVNFNASNLASGIYIYRISCGNYVDSKKMMLIK